MKTIVFENGLERDFSDEAAEAYVKAGKGKIKEEVPEVIEEVKEELPEVITKEEKKTRTKKTK